MKAQRLSLERSKQAGRPSRSVNAAKGGGVVSGVTGVLLQGGDRVAMTRRLPILCLLTKTCYRDVCNRLVVSGRRLMLALLDVANAQPISPVLRAPLVRPGTPDLAERVTGCKHPHSLSPQGPCCF